MKDLLTVLTCVLLAVSFGCAATSEKPVDPMPDPHAGIFSQKCASCHDIARVDEAHRTKTKVEMVEVIKRMKDKPGSNITDEDLDILIRQY